MKRLSELSEIPDSPRFLGFEDRELWQVPGYQRNLPHWRPEDATYFVTFRLADSIPESVARGWQDKRRRWPESRGVDPTRQREDHDGKRFNQALATVPREEVEQFQREQSRQFFVELDRCHGSCVLKLKGAHSVVAKALEHFHGSRIWLGDYVVMPNHVHAITQPFPGVKLEEALLGETF